MNVYQTDLDGVYVGDTTADQDPLDSTNWLIPAGCVETAPPTMTDSQFATWNGTEWVVKNIPVAEPDQHIDNFYEMYHNNQDFPIQSLGQKNLYKIHNQEKRECRIQQAQQQAPHTL